MSGISPTSSLLSSYDPTNPTSIDSSLTNSGLADSYYAQGVNGTAAAPGSESPTTVPLVEPTPSTTAATGAGTGPNVYQQALASLKTWSDTTLITSALGGSSSSSSSGDDSSSITDSLEQAAETQQSTNQAQQQAALNAANSALAAGTNVDTTA
jgi:hypothetical protein